MIRLAKGSLTLWADCLEFQGFGVSGLGICFEDVGCREEGARSRMQILRVWGSRT